MAKRKTASVLRPSRAKKGAQPANENAKKHGFYSRVMTEDELQLVAAFCTDPTLDDEIALQRIANLRLAGALHVESDSGALTLMYSVLSQGLGRVAKLLRDKRMLSGDAADGIFEYMGLALDELTAEFGTSL